MMKQAAQKQGRIFASRGAGCLSLTSVLLAVGILVGVVAWAMQLSRSDSMGGDSRSSIVAQETRTSQALLTGRPGTEPTRSTLSQQSQTPTLDPNLPLLGRRIGLDPGHGPRNDLGAVLVAPDTVGLILSEAELNLDIALRCRDILVARGASVVLTRESEDTFTIPWPADVNGDGIEGETGDDLQARVDILNSFGAEVFLSIHANGGEWDPAVHKDIQVIYCGTADCAFPQENKALGQFVLDHLQARLTESGYSVQGGELVTDLDVDSSDPPEHLFILGPVNPPRHVRATAMPGVLAESLYVTSTAQAAQLKRDSVRQAIALAYADALQAYLIENSGRRP